jgi:ABC-type Fe3+-hydroxamate transport system substrate-binding protein
MVFDFGLGDSLVGITKYCVHPAGPVGAVEKVGGTKDPDVARIIELRPDVVLVNEEENRKVDAEALEAAGLRIANSFPKTSLETAAMLRDYGAVLGCEERAEAIARDVEQRTERVAKSAAARSKTKSFAYLIWRKPWMSVNADTFASALLTQAGGRNVFAECEPRYHTIELAALGEAAPERVLLCTEPFPFRGEHINELAVATGLAPACFRIADGEYLSWHGSRTPAGVDYAEAILWD